MKSKLLLTIALLSLSGFVYAAADAPKKECEKKDCAKKECTCKDGKMCDTCKAKMDAEKKEQKK